MKISIKTKTLILLLGMSSLSLLVFLSISSYFMKKQGADSLTLSMKLGTQAALESKETLKTQTQEYMLTLVKSQAVYTTSLFDKVESGVIISHDYARDLMLNPGKYHPVKTYFRHTIPADPLSTSVVKLPPHATADSMQAEIDMVSNMDDIFKPLLNTDKNVLALYIGTKNGLFKRFPWKPTIADTYDPRTREWFKAGRNSRTSGWTMPYIGATANRLMVTCYKGIFDDKGTFLGVVASDVTVESILKMISTHVKDVGDAYVIDKNGYVIAYPGKLSKYDYTKADNLLKTTNTDFKAIVKNMIAGKIGIRKYTDNEGTEKFLAYAPITNTEWSIGVAIPVDKIVSSANKIEKEIKHQTGQTLLQINSTIKDAQLISISLCLLIIIITALIGSRMASKLSTPIIELTDGVSLVGKGNLDHSITVKTGDEVEVLSDAFNNMTKDLKLYIEELKATTAAKEKIESELEVAKKIQISMLPRIFPAFPDRKEFDIFASMDAAKEVGGDFYDYFLIDKNKLCFTVADVSGKGVPASLFMVVAKTLLKNETIRGIPTNEILYNVNNMLVEDNDQSLFVTAFICILDIETGVIHYSNAGHNPPLLNREGTRDFNYLQVDKNFVIGGMPDIVYTQEELKLETGDTIFLYTDGVTEAMDKTYTLYSEDRLKNILDEIDQQQRNVTSIEDIVKKDIIEFADGADQSDDITILVLKYNGPKKNHERGS